MQEAVERELGRMPDELRVGRWATPSTGRLSYPDAIDATSTEVPSR